MITRFSFPHWLSGTLLLTAIGLQAAPTVTQQPVSPVIALGMSGVTLNVVATGQGTLGYQWLRNGVDLAGATGASLVLTPLDHTTRGIYQVRVTDADGSTLSRMARVGQAVGKLVLWDYGDLNGSYGAISRLAKGGGPVNYEVNVNGTVAGCLKNPHLFEGGKVRRSILYVVGPGMGSRTWVPAGLEPVIALAAAETKAFAVETDGEVKGWIGTSGSPEWPGTTTAYTVPTGLGPCLDISMNAQEVVAVKADGTVVQWAVTTDAVLPATSTPPAGLTDVTALSSSSTHHLALKRDGAVVAWGDNTHGECIVPTGLAGVVEIAAGVGFSLVLKQDGTVVAWGDNTLLQTTIPAGLTNVVSIYASTYCMVTKADSSVISWGQAAPAVPSFITSGVSPGQVMGSMGLYPAVIEPNRVPSVTQQPLSIATRLSYSVTLEVKGIGTVQWQKDGVNIPQATATQLVLRQISAADVGAYRAVFSNDYGTATSQDALVTLLDEPLITVQPADQNVLLGAAAQFSITVAAPASNSALPLSLQWLKNGRIMPGATQATLAFANVSIAEVGDYQAVINGTTAGGTSLIPGAQRSQVARLRIKGEPVAWGPAGFRQDWLRNHSAQPPTTVNFSNTVDVAAEKLGFLTRNDQGIVRGWNVLGIPFEPTGLTPSVEIGSDQGRFFTLNAAGNVTEWLAATSYPRSPYSSPTPLAYVSEQNQSRCEFTNPAGAPIVNVAQGAYHNIGLLEDGGICTWACELTVGTPSYNSTTKNPNTHGQLIIPAGFMTGRSAAAVAAGAYHNVVLFADGTVGAWGKNDAGQATPPTGLSGVVMVEAFGDTSVAVKATGEVVCWGRRAAPVDVVRPQPVAVVHAMRPFRNRATSFFLGQGAPEGSKLVFDIPSPAQLGYQLVGSYGSTLSLSGSQTGNGVGTVYSGTLTLNTGSSSSAGLVITGAGSSALNLSTSIISTLSPLLTLSTTGVSPSVLTISAGTVNLSSNMLGMIQSGSLVLNSGSNSSGLVINGAGFTTLNLGMGTTVNASTISTSNPLISLSTGGVNASVLTTSAGGTLSHSGSGTLTLNSGNNTSGLVITSAGSNTLNLGTGTTVNASTISTSSPVISLSTTGVNATVLTNSAGGTLSLSGSGVSTIQTGTLVLNTGSNSSGLVINGAGSTTLNLGTGTTEITTATRPVIALSTTGANAAVLTTSASAGTLIISGSSLNVGTVATQGSGTLQLQGLTTINNSTTATTSATNSTGTITTSSNLGSTLDLPSLIGYTPNIFPNIFDLPDLGGNLIWDLSAFMGVGSVTPGPVYTSHDSAALQIPTAALWAPVRLAIHEQGGLAQQSDGTIAKWGAVHALPEGLADIVQIAVNDLGAVALRAYTAPRFITDPVSQEVFAGYSGPVFHVQAVGFPAPALQWSKGSTDLPGETLPTLSLTQTTPAATGSYSVTATNAHGSSTSATATLTVTSPAQFTHWQTGHHAAVAIAAGTAAPTADPGGHGVPNLMRYALGLHADSPEAEQLPRLAFGRHPTAPAVVGGLFFCVPENVSDIRFKLAVSTDLTTWKTLDVEAVLGTISGGKRQVWLPCPPNEQDVRKTFYRLIVEPVAPATAPRF